MNNNKYTITIGRQYGSGGRQVGKALAKELGIHFYDREIMRLVSDESGIGESYFHLADERAGNKLLYKIVKSLKPAIEKPINKGPKLVSDENLFMFQAQMIKEISAQESCVIVGRCADYVLKGKENVARIFIYADEEKRIETIIDYEKVSKSEAVKKIKSYDKSRNEYYRYYTGGSWGDMSNYNLVIDSGVLGIENTTRMVIEYLKIRNLI